MEYAIETFSLTKTFSDWWGRNRVVAVDDLNLKIRTNEVFGLLGPNGSGKTTTLKMLLGLLHPTKGKRSARETPPTRKSIANSFPKIILRYHRPQTAIFGIKLKIGLASRLRSCSLKGNITVGLPKGIQKIGLRSVINNPVCYFDEQ
jgi:ABC-type branched-subunit amino acid transport system ATPase component